MKLALLSVTDKTGLITLAMALAPHYRLLSTGGTYETLLHAGLPVQRVEDITGVEELFNGRVKTLHPVIHGGILYERTNAHHLEEAQKHAIAPIDLVVVNLYRFQDTLAASPHDEEAIIEAIDIGGPALIRSAAKNHAHVTVLTDPMQYSAFINVMDAKGEVPFSFKRQCAAVAFEHTAQYDQAIADHFADLKHEDSFSLEALGKRPLRYGENPDQVASVYTTQPDVPYSMLSAQMHHGKALSYNNYLDGDAALSLLAEFEKPTVVAIKHTNPCGVGQAPTLLEAWHKAYTADPVSIFGGIVAFNRVVDARVAQALNEHFLEVILAPSYTEDALKILTQKKNIRVLTYLEGTRTSTTHLRTIRGGLLVQEDATQTPRFDVVTKLAPSESEMEDILFAQAVVKHVKSNAVVLVNDGQTVGIGAGQMNRVGAANIAFAQAGEKARGAVLASDGFFPLPDTVEAAIKAGIKTIVQPGGSLKDDLSIKACDDGNIAMVFNHQRTFKH